jgi:hypothetical protein
MLGPQAEQSFDLDRPLREARDAFEKSYFEFHLAQENGSMTRVAEKTGLERRTSTASSSSSASTCRATSAAARSDAARRARADRDARSAPL